MSEKQNKLGLTETLKLSDWLGRNEEWLKAERPTYQEAADKARKDLGFPVTRANVSALNKARGGVWQTRLAAQREKGGQLLAALVAEALAPALARVAELEDVVARLCKGLGEKPPRAPGAEGVQIVPNARPLPPVVPKVR